MSIGDHGEILAIANQKGGVGKTTTAVNLATGFAAVGKKVLLIDLDPQGNASTGLGVEYAQRAPNTYDMLVNEEPLATVEKSTKIPGLSLLPSVVDLSAIDVELATAEGREYRLRKQLDSCAQHYDYILIDCPPSLGLATINALAAATAVLIPLQCEFYALEGLAHLLHTIDLVKRSMNPQLEIKGILLTMYDRRSRLTLDVEQDVRSYMGDKIFSTVIPRNIRLSEAPSHGKPAIIYDFRCPGSQAYLHLAREILYGRGADAPAVPTKKAVYG